MATQNAALLCAEKRNSSVLNPRSQQFVPLSASINDESIDTEYDIKTITNMATALNLKVQRLAVRVSQLAFARHVVQPVSRSTDLAWRLDDKSFTLDKLSDDQIDQQQDLTAVKDVNASTAPQYYTSYMRDEMPSFIKQCDPLSPSRLSEVAKSSSGAGTFTWTFLTSTLGGSQWSPGFYFVCQTSKVLSPAYKGYYILDGDFDPYIPSGPGQHGAKITAFFNPGADTFESDSSGLSGPDESTFDSCPLFAGVDLPGHDEKQYMYMGQYSQPRLSDRLDHQRIRDIVQEAVKLYWADQLTDSHRPAWATKALMEHFFPRPVYRGPIKEARLDENGKAESLRLSEVGAASKQELKAEWKAYLGELAEWEKEAGMRVRMLTPDDIMKAFDEPDAAEVPGLRLWWEYLVCVGHDEDFIRGLVSARDGKVIEETTKAPQQKRQAFLPDMKAADTTLRVGTDARLGAEKHEASRSANAAPSSRQARWY